MAVCMHNTSMHEHQSTQQPAPTWGEMKKEKEVKWICIWKITACKARLYIHIHEIHVEHTTELQLYEHYFCTNLWRAYNVLTCNELPTVICLCWCQYMAEEAGSLNISDQMTDSTHFQVSPSVIFFSFITVMQVTCVISCVDDQWNNPFKNASCQSYLFIWSHFCFHLSI